MERHNEVEEYKELEGIERWRVFSMSPRSEEEIEKEILRNLDDVCISYICYNSILSCDFIERLICLTTGLLHNDNIKEDYWKVEKVIYHKYFGDDKSKVVSSNTYDREGNKFRFDSKTIQDRVDWKAITLRQTLTFDFIKKYYKYLELRDLITRDYITEEMYNFIKEKM